MIYNKANASKYKYFPKTKKELQDIIAKRIIDKGNDVDLNDIDVSKISDMHMLFGQLPDFWGDVSDWDVSNVTDMSAMFADCPKFKGHLLNDWKLNNDTSMYSAFSNCFSKPDWYIEEE
jgi:hypothetical protein